MTLVLLSNVCYSVSYSFCEMTKRTTCHCLIDNDEKKGSNLESPIFATKSCCTTVTKTIDNSSVFENINRIVVIFTPVTFCYTEFIESPNNIFSGRYINATFTFHKPRIDIPIQNSSLLI